MNLIYSYEPDQYDLIQKMVLCLAKYFRYIVKNDQLLSRYSRNWTTLIIILNSEGSLYRTVQHAH